MSAQAALSGGCISCCLLRLVLDKNISSTLLPWQTLSILLHSVLDR